MADLSQRSYLRDGCGPRVVDTSCDPDKGARSGRRHREADDGSQQRSRHNSALKSPRPETGHRRKSSNVAGNSGPQERPSFEVDVIGQPSRAIILGTEVEISVMISVRLPSPDRVVSTNSIDTSPLLAIVSLVADCKSGERMSLEAGTISGQKMFDSVHPIPAECVESMARSQPCRLALGYFSFPGLLIRQAGTYRIRVTLVKMAGEVGQGGSSIMAVDSEPIRVERQSSTSLRRQRWN